MSVRVLLVACALFALIPAGSALAQGGSPERAASQAGHPIIWRPADRDTVSSVWVKFQGAIPQDLLGKCREVEVFVNAANRGKARLRGLRFSMEQLRLDCLGLATLNSIKAVCIGPSLRVETPESNVMLIPGPLSIEADLSTDAVSPKRAGGAGGRNEAVEFRFLFSTPADWTLKLTGGPEGGIVRAASGKNVPSCEYRWDGTDASGKVVPDGEYMYEMAATSTCGGAGEAGYAGVIMVDTSIPGRPVPVDPVDDDIVSPTFHLRWQPVEGAWFYEVQLSKNEDFDPHEIYSTGARQLRFSGRDDGSFFWRVRAVSRAGTPGQFSPARRVEVRKVMQPAIAMLGVTTKADGLRSEEGEMMRITYMANDRIAVTIRIVTANGEVVKTLLDGVNRDKGPHVELWDGRGDDHEFVPAGAYVTTVEAEGTDDVTPFSENRLVTVQY